MMDWEYARKKTIGGLPFLWLPGVETKPLPGAIAVPVFALLILLIAAFWHDPQPTTPAPQPAPIAIPAPDDNPWVELQFARSKP